MGAGLAAAGEAAIGIGSAAWAHESSKKAQRWEFLNNQSLMREQHAQNINMFNLQNAYNSPSAQMKRLREAGLNPALMYGGKSGGMTGMAQMPHKTDMLSTKGRNHAQAALQGLLATQDVKLKQAQTDNVNASTEKTQEDTKLRQQQTLTEVQNTRIKTFQGDMDKIRSENLKEYNSFVNNDGKYEGIKASVAKMLHEAEITQFSAETSQVNFSILKELWEEDQQVKFYKAKTKNEQFQAALRNEELEIYKMAKLYLPGGKLGLAIFKALFGK